MHRSLALGSLLALTLLGCDREQEPQYAQGPYGPGQPGQPGWGQPGQPGQPQPGWGQPGQPQPGQPQPGWGQPGQPQPGQPQPGQPQPGGQPGMPGFQIPGLPGFTFPGAGQPGAPGQPAQGGAAQPIDPMMASAATIPLMQLKQQHAGGMAEEGPVLAGNFQQGQSLERAFQLMPGKCYTVTATGTVSELDAMILVSTPLPGASPVLAQDNMQGGTAVVGANGACVRWQGFVGMNAKVVITATAGSGLAAAQLYVK